MGGPPPTLRESLRALPPAAWVLFAGTFVNRLGTFVLPFITLYLTTQQHYSVPQAGLAVIEAGQHGVPTIGYRSSGGLSDSIVDGVTGLLVDDYGALVGALDRVLSDEVLREQLGAKAQVRSGEFSWQQSADAMRVVLGAVMKGRMIGGVA